MVKRGPSLSQGITHTHTHTHTHTRWLGLVQYHITQDLLAPLGSPSSPSEWAGGPLGPRGMLPVQPSWGA